MTIKLTGPLTMDEIDAEFGKGKNLGAYHGVAWWTDPPTSTNGNFSNGAISFNDFYGKRKDAPFSIGESARFSAGSQSHMDRTPTVDGNRKVWTWSGWIKRDAKTGGDEIIFSCGVDGTRNRYEFNYTPGNNINYDLDNIGPVASGAVVTDTAWHHLVVSVDTNRASGRTQTYFDGVLVGQNDQFRAGDDTPMNKAGWRHGLGIRSDDNNSFLNAWMADVNFIDGLALTAASFAAAGKPIAYTGAYGTNGFHLDFKDASNLGKDVSGNGNNLTIFGSVTASTDHP